MNNNPFDQINERFSKLEELLVNQKTIIQKAPEKEILTFDEMCKFLDIAKGTGYQYVSKRKIPYSKKFNKLYFSREKLISWVLNNHKQ